MTAIAFDTLVAARGLEAAGMERRQAEAVAEVTAQAAVTGHGELATKADIKDFATKADLAADIARLEGRLTDLEGRLTHLEGRLTAAMARQEARLYLALVGVVFAILAADRLLPS